MAFATNQLSAFNGYSPPIHAKEVQKLHSGQVQIIFGPMFSGKTTELMRRLKRYQIARYRCLIVKYAHDNRYSNENCLSTHDSEGLPAIPALSLNELSDKAPQYDVIGIDEGQFFPDIVEFSERMANDGKTVVVAALDGTYQRQGFGNILQLVPLAESVIKLTAVCMLCCSEASYTQRRSGEKELEVIGGTDKYLAVCRSCYLHPPPPPHTPPPPAAATTNLHHQPPLQPLTRIDNTMDVLPPTSST